MRRGLLEAYQVMARVHFWRSAEKVRLNERQIKALRKALGPRFDGDAEEDGTLSNRYYRATWATSSRP